MPPNNIRANDDDLPEVISFEGLEQRLPPDDKQHHPPPDGLHVNHPTFSGPDACSSYPYSHTTQPKLSPPEAQEKRAIWKRKRCWIPLVCLLLTGGVAGGFAGVLSTHKDTSGTGAIAGGITGGSSTQRDTSGTGAIAGGFTGGSSTQKDSSGTGDSTASSVSTAALPVSTVTVGPAQPSSKLLSSSLASVAWSSPDGLRSRRLYYQDDAGTVKESAWNSSADQWYLSNNNLANAKRTSPIAAAVAGNSTWPFQINVYYIDLQGHVVELVTQDGQSWKNGGLTDEDIIPAVDSDLAALWSQTDHNSCNKCGRQTRLLAYQDNDYKLWVSNFSGPHPVLTQLEAKPSSGTGLAFQSVWHSEGSPGIRLYYQMGTADLITIDYEDSNYGAQVTNDKAWDWTWHENFPIGSVAGGARLASFSWGDDSKSGEPLFQHTLSSGSRGVKVAWLGPGYGTGWQTDTPDVMKNVQTNSPLAANADRHVYALEDGIVKEFVMSPDGLTWSLVGDVLTKN
ncbi:MAG: hypothetical protein Q9213_002081 [Squamulea squamosa]